MVRGWRTDVNRGSLDTVNAKELREVVLALPAEERMDLLQELLLSLEEPPSEEVDAAWVAEIERRIEGVRNGSAEGRPWTEVRSDLMRRLATMRQRMEADTEDP